MPRKSSPELQARTVVVTMGTIAMASCSDGGVTAPPVNLALVQGEVWSYNVTEVRDLGTLGGTTSTAVAVNADTQVVGWSSIGRKSGSPKHAFLWSPSTGMQDLTPDAQDDSEARDINISGTVVGSIVVDGVFHGFRIGLGGQLELLNGLPGGGDRAEASGINDAGQAVGQAWTVAGGQVTHAVRWEVDGTIVDLGALETVPGGGEATAYATDINNQGTVVGWASRTASSAIRAFRWTESAGMEPLLTPSGGDAAAYSVNDDGFIAGYMTMASGDKHAAVWTPSGGVIDLGTLGGSSSTAYTISNSGLVVGVSRLASGAQHPFVWSLGDRVMVDFAGQSSFARGVSENGLVVGHLPRFDGHATLWILKGPCDLFAATPSDTILADAAIQGILVSLGEISNWADPSIKNRIEVGGHLFVRNGVVEVDIWGYHPQVPANPCVNAFVSNLAALLADPNVSVLGEVHTHPASQGMVNYTASDNCTVFQRVDPTTWQANQWIAPWAYGPGPSPWDLADWVSSSPPQWPGYVMSPDSLWRWEASNPPGGPPVISSWALDKGSNACFL